MPLIGRAVANDHQINIFTPLRFGFEEVVVDPVGDHDAFPTEGRFMPGHPFAERHEFVHITVGSHRLGATLRGPPSVGEEEAVESADYARVRGGMPGGDTERANAPSGGCGRRPAPPLEGGAPKPDNPLSN